MIPKPLHVLNEGLAFLVELFTLGALPAIPLAGEDAPLAAT